MEWVLVDTSSILFGMEHARSAMEAARSRFPGRRPLVSKGIIKELGKLSLNKGNKGAAAKAALAEITLKRIDVENIIGNADSWILAKAGASEGTVVVTNDTALARRLLARRAIVYKMSRSGRLSRFSTAKS